LVVARVMAAVVLELAGVVELLLVAPLAIAAPPPAIDAVRINVAATRLGSIRIERHSLLV